MLQIAVFVDAGYLYAQGAKALSGKIRPRSLVRLDTQKTLAKIKQSAQQVCPGGRLLRIYWYDGLPRGGLPGAEQTLLANAESVKLRLGTINSSGRQKGVDSLIVTDLIDLARNRAITDALVLSGDEDIRIGVQIAQTFGVQAHLLGIDPARASWSPDLVQESDTHRIWDKAVIATFLSVTRESRDRDKLGESLRRPAASGTESLESAMDEVIAKVLSLLGDHERSEISEDGAHFERLPTELDRPILAAIRDRIGRDLNSEERKQYRARLLKALP